MHEIVYFHRRDTEDAEILSPLFQGFLSAEGLRFSEESASPDPAEIASSSVISESRTSPEDEWAVKAFFIGGGSTMTEIVLKGHKVSKGRAEGEALVSQSPISFMHGVNPETGTIVEKGHELEGVSITDKILIFPVGKGSTAGSYQVYELSICKKAPKAIINLRADPVIAVGAIMSNIPMVDRLDESQLRKVKTGDLVEVDAGQGVVKVKAKK